MIPIELPILMGATEAPALGPRFGRGDSASAADFMASGLFETLKESFAAALAEVCGEPGDLQNIGQALQHGQGPVDEDRPNLPGALAALVALLKTTNKPDAGDSDPLIELYEAAIEMAAEEIQEVTELDLPAVTPDTATTEDAMSLMDGAVLKTDDQTLARWMESIGVTDKQIQSRALERWLEMQRMPLESRPARGPRLFRFSLPNMHAKVSNWHPGNTQMPEKPLVHIKASVGEGKNAAIVPLPPSGAMLTSTLENEAQPEASATAATPPESGSIPEVSKFVTADLSKEDVKPQDTLMPNQHVTDQKDTGTGNDTRSPSDQNPAPFNKHALGTVADETLPLGMNSKAANAKLSAPGETHPDPSVEDKTTTTLQEQAQLQMEKEKPLAVHHSLPIQKDSSGSEHSVDRAVTTDGNPTLEAATLAKTDTSGRTHSTGMQAREVQTFMRQHAPDVMTQIVDKAVISVKDGHKEMKIALKPEFLGQMRMSVITENQQVTIRILTESPVIKEAIENHLHQLKADLGNYGLNIDRVDVFVSSDSHHQPNNRDTQNPHQGDQLSKEERHAKEERERRLPDDRQQNRSSGNQSGIDYFV